MKFARKFKLRITLLGVMAVPMLFISAYGQQEVDPTWYDPWAPASQPLMKTAQKTDHKKPKKVAAAKLAPQRNPPQVRKQTANATEPPQAASTGEPVLMGSN